MIWQEIGSGSSSDFNTKGKYQNLLRPVPHFPQKGARKEQDKSWWRWQSEMNEKWGGRDIGDFGFYGVDLEIGEGGGVGIRV